MKGLLLSSMHSGAGKTVTVCALLAALRRRGMAVHAFKCGPDYIDPMFHSRVLGVPSRNLDLFLQGRSGVAATLRRVVEKENRISEGQKTGDGMTGRGENGSQQPGDRTEPIAILEGAMGFYDGVAGTDACSAWDLARVTDTPAVLVLRPGGAGLTLAAQVKGLLHFRPDSHIAGLLLTACKPALFSYLSPLLARETGIPVLGYLPPMEEARIESRHLGLLTAREVEDFAERFAIIAKQMEQTVDLDALLALAEGMGNGNESENENGTENGNQGGDGDGNESRNRSRNRERNGHANPEIGQLASRKGRNPSDLGQMGTEPKTEEGGMHPDPGAYAPVEVEAIRVPIAVARDAAFCFYYADNLDLLAEAGAELLYFSPLQDTDLPEGAAGLYLGGGYPELYARQLSGNAPMLRAIHRAVGGGMPTAAECGGFLYLQKSLGDPEGHPYPMCGVLPGQSSKRETLQRFGYQYLRAEKDSLLFRSGECVPAHEFHYWESNANGEDLVSEKPDGRRWRCGYATPSLYAAFPHLHFGGELPMAERFVAAARAFSVSSVQVV